MAKKYRVISPRLNKVMFFVQSLFFGGVGMLFLVSLIYFMIDDPPPAETLVYENCTFVKYEFEQKKGARGSVYNHYYIYVEEYEEPLEIDEMVFQSIKESELLSLRSGDKITVSISDKAYLYSLFYGDDYIWSYEDYLIVHKDNDKVGFIVASMLSCLGFVPFIIGIIHYKKTGEILPFGR